MVAHFHLGCDTGRLEFMEDDPATHFVEQDGLDATMKGIDPRLVILRRDQMEMMSSPSSKKRICVPIGLSGLQPKQL